MRHHDNIRRFGRTVDQRVALMRSLAESLLKHGKIKTTEAKAKELRPYVEKMITKGIKAGKPLREVNRKSGYTRIVKLPPRKSDGSKMAIIEFV